MDRLRIMLLLVGLRSTHGGVDGNSYYPTPSMYVFWPNATIPFYIYPEHFDQEQSVSIMTTLAVFAFKTCLKFTPVLTPPGGSQHVMVFENPRGIRKCVLDTAGHPREEPHRITLGYSCLKSPQIDMLVMRALGFPFEHNRHSRDIYIDVQMENVEPSAVQFFTKDPQLPMELQALPYDINSVMHFGDREYSKNGHRTIIFKDSNLSQNRMGLTTTDVKKIDIVYGAECRRRDRQEKIELCQRYPGVARRKRDAGGYPVNVNLRVNRAITPPPDDAAENAKSNLTDLGIEDEVQAIVDQVYRVSSKVLQNARSKHCNTNKTDLRITDEKPENTSKPDVIGIIESITDYARNMVDNAVANLTVFCEASEDSELYQRGGCSSFNGRPCPPSYRSTKSGRVKYSTQHRPEYRQSTKNIGGAAGRIKNYALRAANSTDNATENKRDKREVHETAEHRPESRDAEKLYSNRYDRDNMKTDEDNTTVFGRHGNVRNQRSDGATPKISSETVDSGEVISKGALRVATEVPSKYKNNFVKNRHRRLFKVTRPSVDSDGEDSSISIERKREELKKTKRTKKNKRNRFSGPRPKSEHKEYKSVTQIKLSRNNEEFYAERKWPNGVVPYVIQEDDNYDTEKVRRKLEEVNDILKKDTCVKLMEITENEAKKYKDFLVIDTSADYVTGRVGGRQTFGSLELFRGGQHRQHAAMMVMAMLGFYFEISRHDRDKYIRVHLRHVRPDKLHHFEKIRSDATLPLPYDYESATHPAWQFWRQVGRTGISSVATYKSLDPDGEIMRSLGQHSKLLSDMDIIKINSVYGIKCFMDDRSMHKEIS